MPRGLAAYEAVTVQGYTHDQTTWSHDLSQCHPGQSSRHAPSGLLTAKHASSSLMDTGVGSSVPFSPMPTVGTKREG